MQHVQVQICRCCRNSNEQFSVKEWNTKDFKSCISNGLFLVFYNKIFINVFGKRLKGFWDINKSWQQAGFVSNLSVVGHVEMVSQVLKKTVVSVSSIECKNIFDLVEVENSLTSFVKNTVKAAMDTLKKFILIWKISPF